MTSKSRFWLKAAVVGFGVADCIGIYLLQQNLEQPVPADLNDSYIARTYTRTEQPALAESPLLAASAPPTTGLQLASTTPPGHHHETGDGRTAVQRRIPVPEFATASLQGEVGTARRGAATRTLPADPIGIAAAQKPPRSRPASTFTRAFAELSPHAARAKADIYEPVMSPSQDSSGVRGEAANPLPPASAAPVLPEPAFGMVPDKSDALGRDGATDAPATDVPGVAAGSAAAPVNQGDGAQGAQELAPLAVQG